MSIYIYISKVRYYLLNELYIDVDIDIDIDIYYQRKYILKNNFYYVSALESSNIPKFAPDIHSKLK